MCTVAGRTRIYGDVGTAAELDTAGGEVLMPAAGLAVVSEHVALGAYPPGDPRIVVGHRCAGGMNRRQVRNPVDRVPVHGLQQRLWVLPGVHPVETTAADQDSRVAADWTPPSDPAKSQFLRPITGQRSRSALMLSCMGISGRLPQTSRNAHWFNTWWIACQMGDLGQARWTSPTSQVLMSSIETRVSVARVPRLVWRSALWMARSISKRTSVPGGGEVADEVLGVRGDPRPTAAGLSLGSVEDGEPGGDVDDSRDPGANRVRQGPDDAQSASSLRFWASLRRVYVAGNSREHVIRGSGVNYTGSPWAHRSSDARGRVAVGGATRGSEDEGAARIIADTGTAPCSASSSAGGPAAVMRVQVGDRCTKSNHDRGCRPWTTMPPGQHDGAVAGAPLNLVESVSALHPKGEWSDAEPERLNLWRSTSIQLPGNRQSELRREPDHQSHG